MSITGQQELANYVPTACFVNKVLLKHSHISLFTYCLWLILSYNRGVEECDRHHMFAGLKYLLSSL